MARSFPREVVAKRLKPLIIAVTLEGNYRGLVIFAFANRCQLLAEDRKILVQALQKQVQQ
jgi:hypothetical protein